MKVTIYTDGSSRGNPGRGGWGAVVLFPDHVKELGGREDLTTNNRMELVGAIEGLRCVRTSSIPYKILEVCTDSEYVKKGMTEWISGWVKKGWKTSTKKDVLNKDLWELLLKESEALKSEGASIQWVYVRGHAGVPLNERADSIATSFADKTPLVLYDAARKDYKEE